MHRNGLKTIVPLIWGVAVVAGFGFLMRSESRPAPERPAALAVWPADAPLPLVPQRANLVLFAHPRCPCTRASLAEAVLAQSRAGGPGRVALTVFFAVPAGEKGWAEAPLWKEAAALPRALEVRVAADPDGRLAARWGATASGHALLFDPAGRLLFSGGVTGMRGEEGDNPGLDAVVALARGSAASGPGSGPGPASGFAMPFRTAVFGCALVSGRTP